METNTKEQHEATYSLKVIYTVKDSKVYSSEFVNGVELTPEWVNYYNKEIAYFTDPVDINMINASYYRIACQGFSVAMVSHMGGRQRF